MLPSVHVLSAGLPLLTEAEMGAALGDHRAVGGPTRQVESSRRVKTQRGRWLPGLPDRAGRYSAVAAVNQRRDREASLSTRWVPDRLRIPHSFRSATCPLRLEREPRGPYRPRRADCRFRRRCRLSWRRVLFRCHDYPDRRL